MEATPRDNGARFCTSAQEVFLTKPVPYVRVRDGVYQYDRRVPLSIQRDARRFAELFGSKPLFRVSLRSKANGVAMAEYARVNAEFERLTAMPCRKTPALIPTILTDNGCRPADLPTCRPADLPTCRTEHGIGHRLTRPNHPWTSNQVERMNRTIKDATVERYHHGGHDEPRQHPRLFIDACNHGRRRKTPRGLTPYGYVARIRTQDPARFKSVPGRHTSGPNI